MTWLLPRLELDEAVHVRLQVRAPWILDALRLVRARALSTLTDRALADLATALLAVELDDLPGTVVDVPGDRGGATVVLAAAKSPIRPLRVHDTFADGAACLTGALVDAGYAPAENRIDLLPGTPRTTLVGTDPIVLAHLGDAHADAVLMCLERLAPRVVPGGRLVVGTAAGGADEHRADLLADFLAGPAGARFRAEQHACAHLVRAW